MRKHWLAVLSILGLAGSASPASAQVLKGSKTADTKSESTIKNSKRSQEDAASKDARKDKWKVQSMEGGHATADAAAKKYRKAGREQPESLKASKKDVVVSDVAAKGKKSDSELKQAGDAAAGKIRKAGGGHQSESLKISMKNVTVSSPDLKGTKSDSELKAMQRDASKKARKQVDQTSPK